MKGYAMITAGFEGCLSQLPFKGKTLIPTYPLSGPILELALVFLI